MDYRRIKTQAIILNGNHVLMVRAEKGTAWVLPGGEVEEGEIPEDGLLRSVNEQTGMEVKIVKNLTREKDVHAYHRIVLTFLAEPLSLKYDPREYEGEMEVEWRSLRSPELKAEIYDVHLKGKERQ